MSVPLDRLYDFIDGLCNQDILIYRWYPHGSKKLEDLTLLRAYFQKYTFTYQAMTTPEMVCHDQEPLDVEAFSEQQLIKFFKLHNIAKNNIQHKSKRGLKGLLLSLNIYDSALLLHSELNSEEVKKFQSNGLIPVYYWSHALISRDWFRYAKHDVTLDKKNSIKDFLIYNRAWSGTREYRLKFAELVIAHQLSDVCLMGFSDIDQGIHYHTHQFKNSDFKISRNNIEDYFFKNTSSSCSSADYVSFDYQSTNIEVVLETLFDDSRHYLTEKTLRPIACKQPFILASTPGSLAYLKTYGFKTFDSLWDESYDLIVDPLERLTAIIKLMKFISSLDSNDKEQLFRLAKEICEYNQQYFFSEKFFKLVVDEFIENFNTGIDKVKNGSIGKDIINIIDRLKTSGDLYKKISREDEEKIKTLLSTQSNSH